MRLELRPMLRSTRGELHGKVGLSATGSKGRDVMPELNVGSGNLLLEEGWINPLGQLSLSENSRGWSA